MHIVLNVLHVYNVPTMLTELLYPIQTLLHIAAREGHTTCVEHLLSTPGIDVNIKDWVSWSTTFLNTICTGIGTVVVYVLHVRVHACVHCTHRVG